MRYLEKATFYFFALLTIFFLGSFLEVLIFYQLFGIQIIPFIELNEIMVIFFENIGIATACGFVFFLPFYLSVKNAQRIENYADRLTFGEFLRDNLRSLIFLMGCTILLLFYSLASIYFFTYEFLFTIFFWWSSFLVGCFVFVKNEGYQLNFSNNKKVSSLMVFLMLFSIIKAGNNFHKVTEHRINGKENIEIILEEDQGSGMDENALLIGMTQKYVFFKNTDFENSEDEKISIIPISRVQKIAYKFNSATAPDSEKNAQTAKKTEKVNEVPTEKVEGEIPVLSDLPKKEITKGEQPEIKLRKNEYLVSKSTSFRKLPTSKSLSWKRLKTNDKVTVVNSSRKDWWQVEMDRRIGWVKKSYLTKG